jgi:hypothetical protein
MEKNFNVEAINRLSGLLPNIQKDLKSIAAEYRRDGGGNDPETARGLALAYFDLLEIEIERAKQAAASMTFD